MMFASHLRQMALLYLKEELFLVHSVALAFCAALIWNKIGQDQNICLKKEYVQVVGALHEYEFTLQTSFARADPEF